MLKFSSLIHSFSLQEFFILYQPNHAPKSVVFFYINELKYLHGTFPESFDADTYHQLLMLLDGT